MPHAPQHPLVVRFLNVKRRRVGLTYDEFGSFFGLSGSMVRAIEKGRSGLGRDTLGVILVRYPSWQPLIDNYLHDAGMRVLGKRVDAAESNRIDAEIGDDKTEGELQ